MFTLFVKVELDEEDTNVIAPELLSYVGVHTKVYYTKNSIKQYEMVNEVYKVLNNEFILLYNPLEKDNAETQTVVLDLRGVPFRKPDSGYKKHASFTISFIVKRDSRTVFTKHISSDELEKEASKVKFFYNLCSPSIDFERDNKTGKVKSKLSGKFSYVEI